MFQILHIARSALQVQESALQTATHNLANAERPEYARQRQIRVAETARISVGGIAGQIGMGVRVAATQRVRDPFFDRQIRGELGTTGEWAMRAQALQIIEGILDEMGDTGLQTVLSRWFDSLQELSKQPESQAVRALVAQRGQELASALNALARQLDAQVAEYEFQLRVKVERANELAVGIHDLSQQITRLQAMGQMPNDLMDQRDQMLDELARLLRYQIIESPVGDGRAADLRVIVEGRILTAAEPPLKLERSAAGQLVVMWAGDGAVLQSPDGEIGGSWAAAYEILPHYRQALDQFAAALLTAVNALHRAGFDLDGNPGGSFFTGTGAADIAVSAAILADPRRIAASATGAIGDGAQALAIAQLAGSTVVGGSTPTDFLNEIIGEIAVSTADAIRREALSAQIVAHYTDRRQAVMGVSQDEEMADIIKFQKAYAAMARVVAVTDQMLDDLINMVRR